RALAAIAEASTKFKFFMGSPLPVRLWSRAKCPRKEVQGADQTKLSSCTRASENARAYDGAMEHETDIALIGAGPLGIEMAVGLKRAGLKYIHLEAKQVGATMQWWPPGTRWFSSNERISIAGVPLETPHQEKATREEYLAYLRSVVMQFALKIHTYTRVIR